MGENQGLNTGYAFVYKKSQNGGFFLTNDQKLAYMASFFSRNDGFSLRKPFLYRVRDVESVL